MGDASCNEEGVHECTSSRKMKKRCSMKPTHGVQGKTDARVSQELGVYVE